MRAEVYIVLIGFFFNLKRKIEILAYISKIFLDFLVAKYIYHINRLWAFYILTTRLTSYKKLSII